MTAVAGTGTRSRDDLNCATAGKARFEEIVRAENAQIRSRARETGQDIMIAFASDVLPKASTVGKRIWGSRLLLIAPVGSLVPARYTKEIRRNEARRESLSDRSSGRCVNPFAV